MPELAGATSLVITLNVFAISYPNAIANAVASSCITELNVDPLTVIASASSVPSISAFPDISSVAAYHH